MRPWKGGVPIYKVQFGGGANRLLASNTPTAPVQVEHEVALDPCLVKALADHVGVTWINTQWWTLNNIRIHVGINTLHHSPTAADLLIVLVWYRMYRVPYLLLFVEEQTQLARFYTN